MPLIKRPLVYTDVVKSKILGINGKFHAKNLSLGAVVASFDGENFAPVYEEKQDIHSEGDLVFEGDKLFVSKKDENTATLATDEAWGELATGEFKFGILCEYIDETSRTWDVLLMGEVKIKVSPELKAKLFNDLIIVR